MKNAYRLCLVALSTLICLSFTGCSKLQEFLDEVATADAVSKEDRIYNEAVDAFFNALDARDGAALKAQFSVKVQRETEDLDEQISKLLEMYQGPTEINKRAGASTGSYSNHYGDHESLAGDTFVVVSGGEYYWCHLEYMYEFDTDGDRIGVTQVLFFEADDYCYYRYEDGWKMPSAEGLQVFADKSLDCEVCCAGGYPYKYTSGMTLNEAEVKEFLGEHRSYSEFLKKFGQPCGEDVYYIYELVAEDDVNRYLRLSVDEKNDTINSVSVIDDFEWKYLLWENKD